MTSKNGKYEKYINQNYFYYHQPINHIQNNLKERYFQSTKNMPKFCYSKIEETPKKKKFDTQKEIFNMLNNNNILQINKSKNKMKLNTPSNQKENMFNQIKEYHNSNKELNKIKNRRNKSKKDLRQGNLIMKENQMVNYKLNHNNKSEKRLPIYINDNLYKKNEDKNQKVDDYDYGNDKCDEILQAICDGKGCFETEKSNDQVNQHKQYQKTESNKKKKCPHMKKLDSEKLNDLQEKNIINIDNIFNNEINNRKNHKLDFANIVNNLHNIKVADINDGKMDENDNYIVNSKEINDPLYSRLQLNKISNFNNDNRNDNNIIKSKHNINININDDNNLDFFKYKSKSNFDKNVSVDENVNFYLNSNKLNKNDVKDGEDINGNKSENLTHISNKSKKYIFGCIPKCF